MHSVRNLESMQDYKMHSIPYLGCVFSQTLWYLEQIHLLLSQVQIRYVPSSHARKTKRHRGKEQDQIKYRFPCKRLQCTLLVKKFFLFLFCFFSQEINTFIQEGSIKLI